VRFEVFVVVKIQVEVLWVVVLCRVVVGSQNFGGFCCLCLQTKIMEHHHWHIQLYYPEKSAKAEYSIHLGHRIQFHKMSILTKGSVSMERLVKEAVEIELHPDNMNKEEHFPLSMS
jgi:hypothetical protein